MSVVFDAVIVSAIEEIAARIRRVRDAPTDRFVELISDAGLDPATDLRFFNWSGVHFFGCDLRSFDFTGANLTGCRFEGARIAGARFDAAQVERTALQRAKDWRDYARSWTRLAHPPTGRHLPDLAAFSDAPFASEMVVIPAGSFLMGSPPDEEGRHDSEGPHHRAIIGYRFAIGRYVVTFEEYDHFCEETDREKPADERWGRRGRRPVINVSWRDAQAYCEWLAKETGQPYRLPSEAEWEYACRAGTTTRYAFGNTITPKDANYIESMIGKTTEVGSYPPNPWSVYDLHGNVWEWVEDVWHDDYKGAPADGSAWTDSKGKQSSRNRIVRGGSWGSIPGICRSANRDRYVPGNRNLNPGFRVARTLD